MAEENVEVIVEEGAVDALVQHLRAPISEEEDGSIAYEHEVEKDAAFALGLLAVKVRAVPFNHQDLTLECDGYCYVRNHILCTR